MSLTSKIIFVTSMLLCAGLCTWAAIAFGGPATTTMWVLAGLCVLVSVIVLPIKGPRVQKLEDFRVAGAREPTFRLLRWEKGAKGEIWQLVLGKSQCVLIRPDGTPATMFARKWVETGIKLPGFTSGDLLGVVTEDWTPPDEDRGITPGEILRAASKIRHATDRDTPYYWFSATKDLIQEIDDYQARTRAELGYEAAGPLRIKARQCILGWVIGLAAGLALLLYGVANLTGPGQERMSQRVRPAALGAVILLIGLWRLGQGIVLHTQAREIS